MSQHLREGQGKVKYMYIYTEREREREMEKCVCVTGASGFIGSWITRLLLQRGYHVRATVQNLCDEEETRHLKWLEGADERLELFEADLLDYEALASAIGSNSSGVFHVASPCTIDKVKDPQKSIIEPAIKGTLHVLTASQLANVKRVVVTSSVSSMFPNPKLPEGTIVDENSWTDIDYCKENGFWYPLSKTLAEKAAWEFRQEMGLDIVCINPGCVLGCMLQPKLNASSGLLLNLLKGSTNPQENSWFGCVNVQDIAKAHILLYETPSAHGRYLCTESITRFHEFAEEVARMYPQYNVHRFEYDTHPTLVRCSNPAKRLLDLGFTFTPTEQTIRDGVSSLEEHGFLST